MKKKEKNNRKKNAKRDKEESIDRRLYNIKNIENNRIKEEEKRISKKKAKKKIKKLAN